MLKRIIHVDARPAEVDQHYIPEVEIVAGVRETLEALRAELPAGARAGLRRPPARGGDHRAARLGRARRRREPAGRDLGDPRARWRPSDILISDVGAHKLWLGRLFPAYEPNTVIVGNGFATMGIGLPGAIAATLAVPDRRVVAVSGDGGFLMNVQEMETATRLGPAGRRGGLGGRRLRRDRLEAGAPGRLFPAYEPNTVIVGNGFASMGIALPGAIAATLAVPDRRVVAVSGDGGFLMNVQEMETATRLGAPVTVVVWVDGAYGVIGWKQERRFGRTHAIHFGNPDFADLARAFGWSHRHATDGPALGAALGAAFAEGGPALITVPIDYRQNVRLANLGEPSLSA